MSNILTHAFLIYARLPDDQDERQINYHTRMHCWHVVETILWKMKEDGVIGGYLPTAIFNPVPDMTLGAEDRDLFLAALHTWRAKPLLSALDLMRQMGKCLPVGGLIFFDSCWLSNRFYQGEDQKDLQLLSKVLRLASGEFSVHSYFYTELTNSTC